MEGKIILAKKYCLHCHEGQTRKFSGDAFSTHPYAVAEILRKYGYGDKVTQCIAYLHDVVEDAPIHMNEITEIFGFEIANGVYILSKNKGKIIEGKKLTPDEYKMRLGFSRKKIQRVKIADMIHNTLDIEKLNPTAREKKMKDSEKFYIPLGKEICPIMVMELINNIERYKKLFNSKFL
ncbi:HD domain-containing protein [Candidatus Pacearchaeota archaeon]|nr:HD domain-containing protein [Candidatus Pacearchaeota archaeon]